MPADISNDNVDEHTLRQVQAHGQAALLLVESLIHGLIARRVITVADAVEIVDVADEVAREAVDMPLNRRKAQGLLSAIGDSLRRDMPSE